jgi:hypothetical protein
MKQEVMNIRRGLRESRIQNEIGWEIGKKAGDNIWDEVGGNEYKERVNRMGLG